MNTKPRIGWICNSSIGKSETFLIDNLSIIREIGDVKAYSGSRNPKKDHESIQQCDFDDVPQRLHHVIQKKITGIDPTVRRKRRRCVKQLLHGLKEYDPVVVWIEFGTTAHVAADLLRYLDKPFIIAVHGFDIKREFKDPYYQKEFTRIANLSESIVCASDHTKNLCIAAGVDDALCKVIRLPLDGQRNLPKNQSQAHPASFVHLGRLVEKKGPLQTVMAFERVLNEIPDATLTIIGEGPLRQTVEERIHKTGIGDSIRLTGALPQSEALGLVQEQAIFCQHSVTGTDGDQEGFALSPAEAALMEMPVISTLYNGIPEHVIHGETGLLVREWDIEGMAKVMIELATNPEKALVMGKAGRQNILKLCDPSSRKAALESLIKSLS